MVEYYIYKISSGEIVQVGVSEPAFLEDFKSDGLCIAKGKATLKEDIVVNGVLQKRDPQTLAQIKKSELVESILFKRNEFLKDSDWTQLPDAPVDHQAWAVYRQALRDLPANTDDPSNVVWPKRPA